MMLFMKKIQPLLQTLFFLLLIGVVFIACSKKEDKPEYDQYQVTATIRFSDGRTVDYKGALLSAVWVKEDNVNILSLTSKDKDFNNAILTFGIPQADGPGTYSLASHELMSSSARLVWDGMEWENWMGFDTGDADGDGTDDGGGTFTIKTLNEQHTEGTFSVEMGNDRGEKITVEGKFDCKVMRQVE